MSENVEISGIEPQTLVRYCQDGGCWGLEAHQVQPLVKAPLTAKKEVPILGAKRRGSTNTWASGTWTSQLTHR